MAGAIYKPGQGYWTRVMTAVFGGVLVLAAAAWLYGQGLLIPLPDRAWQASLDAREVDLAPGDSVDLLGPAMLGEREVVGSATVEAYDEATRGGVVTLADPQLLGEAERPLVQALRSPDGRDLAIAGGVRGLPVVDRIYVQGGLVLVAVLAGAGLLYYFVAANKSSAEFLIATDGEMRKVNWSSRKDVLGSTWVVIGASVLLAICLLVVDVAFATFFRSINVLDG